MMRREGDRLVLSGALTLANAAEVLRQGKAAIGEGARSVDLGGVGELDSSALALLFALRREAKRLDGDLAFTGLPPDLVTIARLYGVADMLAASAASAHH